MTTTKHLIPLLAMLLLSACNPFLSFEKDYYERVTGIKFPDNYDLVTSVDNGAFVTATILDLEKSECREFVRSIFSSVMSARNMVKSVGHI